jgi:hypothetical protein
MKSFASIASLSAVFAALIVAAAPSQAQTSEQSLTREQVRAELAQSRANGDYARLTDEGYGYLPAKHTGPRKSRQQVQAELEQARTDGTLAAETNDSYGFIQPTRVAQDSKSRAEVRAEYVRARKAGETNTLDEDYPEHIAATHRTTVRQ